MGNDVPDRLGSTCFACMIAGVLACTLLVRPTVAQDEFYIGAPIHYLSADVHDPVAKLAQEIEAGEQTLEYDATTGYLPSLLKRLDIPISSQALVFSKTSLQQRRISPHRPRAIYFNDEVYVGYSQNGEVIELAATDASQGATFYTLAQSKTEKPTFVRDRGQCLSCHVSHRTQDIPGYLVRSVFADEHGRPEFGEGTFTSDHSSPFEERWGGWYVTGTHGDMRHMGNATFDKEQGELDIELHANLTSLKGLVSTAHYPGEHSDIVALMVLEHQTQMHNALAWANYETRRAIHQSEIMNEAFDRPAGHLSESSVRRIDRAADRILEYMLFCDEFRLTSPVKGTSSFTKEFQSRGLRDTQGRSLRDLDLTERMFRYPCSYMIHSVAFDGLPEIVRMRTLEKLHVILDGDLSGKDAERYRHLGVADRRNVKAILMETNPGFAAFESNDER